MALEQWSELWVMKANIPYIKHPEIAISDQIKLLVKDQKLTTATKQRKHEPKLCSTLK